MSIIDSVWDYIHDGKWHSTVEIAEKFLLNPNAIQEILTFLLKYEFIELDEVKLKARTWEGTKLDKIIVNRKYLEALK